MDKYPELVCPIRFLPLLTVLFENISKMIIGILFFFTLAMDGAL
jgi:hypothetical protein